MKLKEHRDLSFLGLALPSSFLTHPLSMPSPSLSLVTASLKGRGGTPSLLISYEASLARLKPGSIDHNMSCPFNACHFSPTRMRDSATCRFHFDC